MKNWNQNWHFQEACGLGDLHAVKSVLSSFSGGGGGPGGGSEATSQQESNSQKKNPSDQNTDTVSALVNFAPNGANTCNKFVWEFIL